MEGKVEEDDGSNFPKLEPTWGDMDCPYPKAPFESVRDALLHGGQYATFIYPERAVSNLICAAWRDKAWKNVVVICSGRRSCNYFREMISKIAEAMGFDDQIMQINDERVRLTGGRTLTVLSSSAKTLRGISGDCVIFCTTPPIEDIVLPMAEFSDAEIYSMSVLFDSFYEKRQAAHRHEGPWNATLRMMKL